MKTFGLATTQSKPPRLWQVVGLRHSHGMAVLDQIHKGLDGKVARLIMKWANMTQNDLSKACGISSMEFSRSTKTRFSAEQSERLVRLIRAIDHAVELFEGNKEGAQKWLNEPNRALRWKTPVELMTSETGAYEVMMLISRLEHGVIS